MTFTKGACHLDATMVATAIEQLDLDAADLLLIENIGNLVCTADFDLDEHLRSNVQSVTEGDDKAVKYAAIFQGSDALFVTKTDLLPRTNVSMDRITSDMRRWRSTPGSFKWRPCTTTVSSRHLTGSWNNAADLQCQLLSASFAVQSCMNSLLSKGWSTRPNRSSFAWLSMAA